VGTQQKLTATPILSNPINSTIVSINKSPLSDLPVFTRLNTAGQSEQITTLNKSPLSDLLVFTRLNTAGQSEQITTLNLTYRSSHDNTAG
jgi:hypothetical protein